MDFSVSSEQREIIEAIKRFATRELNQDVISRDKDQIFDRKLWDKCGEMGLTGLAIDSEYGGMGYDAVTTSMALEAFGYGCHDNGLVFSVCAHLLACTVPINKHGSQKQKNEILPDLCSGKYIAVNAMTEPDTGSNPFAMKSTAKAVEGGYLLNGTKIFSTNGPIADIALVYAMTDKDKGFHGGISAFLVKSDTPGFEVGQKFEKMGLRTSPIGELVFNDVFVPADAMLGAVGGGARIFSESMDWERACLVSAHVGTMQRLLEGAISYARTRVQGGQAIGKNQAVSHRLASMRTRIEASRLMALSAAWALENSRMASINASMTKLFISEAYQQTAMDNLQIYGGNGFMVECEHERYVRDSTGCTIYSGTSDIQRNIIAGWLGL
ncbi:acyl-CoA dehydrogenase family protein [Paraglaciecola arctica]|uniref:Probable acyl-CoA dehydrogenase yngJ n=1 Tax=Paraglaciecola arctica BSs20135 TaxID=493475 RepID=K6XN37_9ALTE|nr:acyl-CoA dehydrogenase family protein [Paraglaciecola arctica]GAC22069.1 probable acyl-CoA dehydrogenase yngJ [Paraglaciecola arctica BSs20135]